jgi:hypothetical protein
MPTRIYGGYIYSWMGCLMICGERKPQNTSAMCQIIGYPVQPTGMPLLTTETNVALVLGIHMPNYIVGNHLPISVATCLGKSWMGS